MTEQEQYRKLSEATGLVTREDIQKAGREALWWLVSHQRAGETIVSLTPRQFSLITSRDMVGIIEFPMIAPLP